jgi:hypothetical protein
LGRSNARIWPLPPRTVREDWIAWLPADKDELFGRIVEELEALYSMLSISLNEALTLRRESALVHAREQVGISAVLFDRLSGCLAVMLGTLENHSRHFGTVPNAVPLNPQYFRGETAQRYAKKNALLGKVLLSMRSRYFHKLRLLSETVGSIQVEYRDAAGEISDGVSSQPGAHWGELDNLHYDMNTCLRETMILCKSFLCALPNGEVKGFRRKLEACSFLAPHANAALPLRPRRAAQL